MNSLFDARIMAVRSRYLEGTWIPAERDWDRTDVHNCFTFGMELFHSRDGISFPGYSPGEGEDDDRIKYFQFD